MAERGPKTAVPWLSEPEMQCWRTMISVTTGTLGALDSELQAEHGLSLGDYEVLVHLSEEPGALPAHDRSRQPPAPRRAASPAGSTASSARAWWSGGNALPTAAGSNAVLTEEGMRRLGAAAPTHVRGVRAHFIDQLSDREIATPRVGARQRCTSIGLRRPVARDERPR